MLNVVTFSTDVVSRVGMVMALFRQKIGLLQVYVPLSVQVTSLEYYLNYSNKHIWQPSRSELSQVTLPSHSINV
jgi:hypothetical protein